MRSIHLARWTLAFAATIYLTVVMAIYAGEGLDLGMILVVFIPIGVVAVLGLLLATGLTAWLWRPFRRYFLPLNLSCLLLLFWAFVYYLYGRASFPAELTRVQAYVALADPALENYYQLHGHYPDSLDQIDLKIHAPPGVWYRHVFDGSGVWGNYASSQHHSGGEIYLIDFSNAHYCGQGQWFVDH